MTDAPRPAITTRFAPSPNGPLHLGHAYSALLNFEVASRLGGRFLLRIEDIDRERCQPQFEAAIYRDLSWLGLAWEEPVRRQSEHFADYERALGRLRAAGLVYPAFMSRAEVARIVGGSASVWPTDPDGAPLYPPQDRALDPALVSERIAGGHPFSFRLNMERVVAAAHSAPWLERATDDWRLRSGGTERWGDVVIARRDVPTSYHLAVVIDDALQGVTDVVRGADLAAATSVHRLLQTLLGLPTPRYAHHRLIADSTGAKLAKSSGSTGLAELRSDGMTPRQLREALAVDADADRLAAAIASAPAAAAAKPE